MCHLFIYSDDGELVSLAESCWLKVMTERQRTLEENYKMEISASHKADKGPVRMRDVSPLWEEMASKTWLLYSGQPSVAAHRTMKEMEQTKKWQKKIQHFFFVVFSQSLRRRGQPAALRVSWIWSAASSAQRWGDMGNSRAPSRWLHPHCCVEPGRSEAVPTKFHILQNQLQSQWSCLSPPVILVIWLYDGHRISLQYLKEVYLLSNPTLLQVFRIVWDLLEEVGRFQLLPF